MTAEIHDRATLVDELIERHAFGREFGVDRLRSFAGVSFQREPDAPRSSSDIRRRVLWPADEISLRASSVTSREDCVRSGIVVTKLTIDASKYPSTKHQVINVSVLTFAQMPTNCATPEGTARYRERFADRAAQDHFRQQQGLVLSSIGIGTYLGNPDEATDANYTNAVVRAVQLGVNVIDSAANYRFQRSERSIGQALKTLTNEHGIRARGTRDLHERRLSAVRRSAAAQRARVCE